MALTVANFMQNLEMFRQRTFTTVFQQKPFRLVFHDTTKLRIALENRDISVPISILLFGIAQLLAVKEFDRDMCISILGKDWGYQYVARLLLECDDVCIKPGVPGLVLSRVRLEKCRFTPVKPPGGCGLAKNPANGHNK